MSLLGGRLRVNNQTSGHGILVVIAATLLAVARAGAQCQTEQLLAPDDPTGFDRFGSDVDIEGDRIIVGGLGINDVGAAYVFKRHVVGSWLAPFKLTPSDAELGQRFGISTAMDGDVVIVGSDLDDDLGQNVGSAYVFRRGEGETWNEEQKLLPSLPNPMDQYGYTVAIDHPYIVVCAKPSPSRSEPGNAYVYVEESPGVWIEEARLQGSDTVEGDQFGFDVAIDGDTLIVGAISHDDGRDFNTGAAYVFHRNADGVWREEAKVVPIDPMAGDAFGISVDLQGDLAAIGAAGVDAPADNEGAVYVFARQPDRTWLQLDKIEAPEIIGPVGLFGAYLALDGDRLLVGAHHFVGAGPGYAFLYERNGSRWELDSTLRAEGGQYGDRFGGAVALQGDFAIIGAWGFSDDLGTAYVMGGLLGIDCNENGERDACEIADGSATDCNRNEIPDECDIAEGVSEDCNENTIPDECDVVPPFFAESGELGPIGFDSPQSFVIAIPPGMFEDVALEFTAVADLLSANEFIDVDINGVAMGSVFAEGAQDCPQTPNEDEIIIPAEVFNDAVGGGDAVITMTATNTVNPLACEGNNYITVALRNSQAGMSDDDNNNGIPDECETPGDLDADGMVGAADLLILLSNWGPCADCDDCPADLNGDCSVGAADLLILLANWG